MQDNYNPQSGVIVKGDKRFNFYLDNYYVTFMDIESAEIQLDSSFVFGYTYGYKNIAIYKGENPISLYGMKTLNTSAYIIATENALCTEWSSFDYIEFRGGILNKLFFCRALTRERKDDGSIQLSSQDDSLHHKFEFGDCTCELIIGSASKEYFGLTGASITNNEVVLHLKFSNSQPLESAFNHIGKVKELLSIMTFRKNIDFDEIYLCHSNRALSKMRVFLKSDTQTTEKDIMHNITFHELRDGVSELASTIFNSKDKQPAYEIGFVPISDKDIHLISNDKVRLICSALECELSFVDDLCVLEEEHLQELIKEIKEHIKKHRSSANKLSSKTYDLIFSSINNWSMSASDKICKLYHLHEKAMTSLVKQMNENISDEDILTFIKYRNNITHGAYRVMDQRIATTAFILQGLVYCCLLKRIGISEDSILSLCQNGKILH